MKKVVIAIRKPNPKWSRVYHTCSVCPHLNTMKKPSVVLESEVIAQGYEICEWCFKLGKEINKDRRGAVQIKREGVDHGGKDK